MAGKTAVSPTTSLPLAKIKAAVNLAQAIREYGHLDAQLDPLGTPPPGEPTLTLADHNLTGTDLRQLPADLIGGFVAADAPHALAAITRLRDIYANTIGYDYDHLRNHEERRWLRNMAETRHFRPPHTPIKPEDLLKRLTLVETFEQFLQCVFPGKILGHMKVVLRHQ